MAKKQLARDYYSAPPYDVILRPQTLAGAWQRAFGRPAPLHVEIGMGLGHHLIGFAATHPDWSHVGLELKMHRIYTARHMALRQGIRNVRFVPGDALKALDTFADGEVDHLTMLFPDPWPEPLDAHKRLTAPSYIALYRRVLAPGGRMHFRTDDPDLFRYSMETFTQAGFDLTIHVPVARITTAFERRWLSEGRGIYGLDATKRRS
ncbi:MAG TPA: tRNA (guanosine(46)-N7)-methyltransferase TrmB [Oscillatoriaceae cyanobacterium]